MRIWWHVWHAWLMDILSSRLAALLLARTGWKCCGNHPTGFHFPEHGSLSVHLHPCQCSTLPHHNPTAALRQTVQGQLKRSQHQIRVRKTTSNWIRSAGSTKRFSKRLRMNECMTRRLFAPLLTHDRSGLRAPLVLQRRRSVTTAN